MAIQRLHGSEFTEIHVHHLNFSFCTSIRLRGYYNYVGTVNTVGLEFLWLKFFAVSQSCIT